MMKIARNRQRAWAGVVFAVAFVAWFASPRATWADSAAATQPTSPVKTGEVELTFTERSPLSTQKEVARRLNLKPAELQGDYILSKCPYKAFVPTNYDSAVPHGLFVYLGYKDSVSTPPLWRPILEKDHLIFITPECHSGQEYAPSVPLWQMAGLALDAVYNCKKQFNIDEHRVYLMSWVNGSMLTSCATADVFTGFVVTVDFEHSSRIEFPNKSYSPGTLVYPPADLMSYAKTRAFFLIDDGVPEKAQLTTLIAAGLRRQGFAQVMKTSLSMVGDVHYPNMKAEWFEQQALPFLEKSSATAEITKPATASATTAPAAPPAQNVNEPEHLLGLARLYISNGQTDLAQKKLQQIIDTYPTDPAAQKAKELLAKLNQ